jgi:hypothetical protein
LEGNEDSNSPSFHYLADRDSELIQIKVEVDWDFAHLYALVAVLEARKGLVEEPVFIEANPQIYLYIYV